MTLAAALLPLAAACGSSGTAPVPGPAIATDIANAAASAQLATVDLRSVRPFAVLAGSTVTSTGKSDITGDVGIFPGSAMTGFPPGIIHGTLHVAGPIAKQAEMDLKAAYNDAAGRSSS